MRMKDEVTSGEKFTVLKYTRMDALAIGEVFSEQIPPQPVFLSGSPLLEILFPHFFSFVLEGNASNV